MAESATRLRKRLPASPIFVFSMRFALRRPYGFPEMTLG
jgi:hypothetical protein